MPPMHQAAARGFNRGTAAYDRGRPGYPPEALAFLTEAFPPNPSVLELGAGTGKFTVELARLAKKLLALEPVGAMREKLVTTCPSIASAGGVAEALPIASASFDAVVAAQAFHWFASDTALREIHRVLKPGGLLALVWNRRDTSEPWVAALDSLWERHQGDVPRYGSGAWKKAFEPSSFELLKSAVFSHAHPLTVEQVVDRVASISFISALPDAERAKVLEAVRQLLAEHPDTRGKQTLALPYATDVFLYRAQPSRRPSARA